MKCINKREITKALIVGAIIKLIIFGVVSIPVAYGFSQNALLSPVGVLIQKIQENLAQPNFGREIAIVEEGDPKINAWLDKLETKEDCPEKGMMDTNGLKSYGKLCFQERTFVYYSLKYNVFPHALEHELPNLMASRTEQRKLARVMLENEPDAWTHWLNSTKKIGKP